MNSLKKHEENMKIVINLSKFFSGHELLEQIMKKVNVKKAQAYKYLHHAKRIRYKNIREKIGVNTINQGELLWNLLMKASKKLDEAMLEEDLDLEKIKRLNEVVATLNQEHTKVSNLLKDIDDYLPNELNINMKKLNEIKALIREVGLLPEIEMEIDKDVQDDELMSDLIQEKEDRHEYNVSRNDAYKKKFYFDKKKDFIKEVNREESSEEEYLDEISIAENQVIEEIAREENLTVDELRCIQDSVDNSPVDIITEDMKTKEDILLEDKVLEESKEQEDSQEDDDNEL